MGKRIIYLDMDNTLVSFQSGIDKLDAITLDKYPELDEVPGIYSLMEPMEGAVAAIEKLSETFDVYALSTAPWNNPSAWSDKLNWIKKYFPVILHKKLILTHNKNLNLGDYLIDDRLKNGAGEFLGELIHFGTENYPNWKTVVEYLTNEKMSKVKDLIEQVKESAKKELEFCNSIDTPAVCQLISDAKGKEMVVKLIVEYVGKNGMTIGEAINYIERENNPQLSN